MKTYRRFVSAGIYASVSCLLIGAGALTGVAVLIVIAVLPLAFAALRATSTVAIDAETVSENTWPRSSVNRAAACRFVYERATALGPRNLRVACFILEDFAGVRVAIPRYGYKRETRRRLFHDLSRWLESSTAQVNAKAAARLQEALR